MMQVPARMMEEGALRLTVIDVDKHKRQHVIGHIVYQLKAHDVRGRTVVRRDLQGDTQDVC